MKISKAINDFYFEIRKTIDIFNLPIYLAYIWFCHWVILISKIDHDYLTNR